jgi:hypothetical protein
VAAAFSLSTTAVHTILVAHNEPRRPPGYHYRPPTAAQATRDAEILNGYRSGKSMHVVARELGISTSLVWKVLARHNEPRHLRGRLRQ